MSISVTDGSITVPQAEEISGYSRLHIYNLLRSKKVKAAKYRFGGLHVFLIDRDSFVAYLVSRGREVLDSQRANGATV